MVYRGPHVCPACGERVSAFAAGCAICGQRLDPKRTDTAPKDRSARFIAALESFWRRRPPAS